MHNQLWMPVGDRTMPTLSTSTPKTGRRSPAGLAHRLPPRSRSCRRHHSPSMLLPNLIRRRPPRNVGRDDLNYIPCRWQCITELNGALQLQVTINSQSTGNQRNNRGMDLPRTICPAVPAGELSAPGHRLGGPRRFSQPTSLRGEADRVVGDQISGASPGARSSGFTSSPSNQRIAGRSVATTGRPAARYSSVFSGKLPRLNALSR